MSVFVPDYSKKLTNAASFPGKSPGNEVVTSPTVFGHFGFLCNENLVRDYMFIVPQSFSESFVFEIYFPSTCKRKTSVFYMLRVEECFRKAPFSWRISVDDCGLTVKVKAVKLCFQTYGKNSSHRQSGINVSLAFNQSWRQLHVNWNRASFLTEEGIILYSRKNDFLTFRLVPALHLLIWLQKWHGRPHSACNSLFDRCRQSG